MMWYRNVSNIGCEWENYNVAILPTEEGLITIMIVTDIHYASSY